MGNVGFGKKLPRRISTGVIDVSVIQYYVTVVQ